MKLTPRIVEKPWGRTDIPAAFGNTHGRHVGEVWFEHPDGDAAPLMVKFLFTSQRLSIQVHPDDDAALAMGYPRGKDECWLVLDTAGDCELGIGLLADTNTQQLRQSAQAGTIESLIDWRPAHVGDFVYSKAGTIHALGAGLMVVEVQQNVDCTFRLYDYDRLDHGNLRELHLDVGLAVASVTRHTEPRDRSLAQETGNVALVNGPAFSLVRACGPVDHAALPAGELTVTPLGDGCMVDGEAVHFGECAITHDAASIHIAHGAYALIAWPA
ncbi:MAG: class I mannose-6-phosphate isomerase [Sphingopyxis sp.]